jgi:flagellar motor switch protein FliN/FliY
MSDILSQEQIDALLGGFGGTSSSMDVNAGSSASPGIDKYTALTNVIELFCQQAGTVITTVINKKTTFAVELTDKTDFSYIKGKIPGVVLSLTISFKSGVEGDCFLIIQKKDVAILSDLMMMGDGTAEYSEDHKDAIGELFNQVLGAYTTAIGSEMGITLTAGSIDVTEFDMDNPPMPSESFDMVMISMNADDGLNSYVTLLVPSTTTDQFAEVSPGASGGISSSSSSVGLNMSEIDDLSKVTSFDSVTGSSFTETNMAGLPVNAPRENIEMLLDIDLDVSIELGKTLLSVKRILELAPGSIVELDRMAGEPVDLLVNSKVVAKGEVVVIDESFGIRIVSLVSPEERIKSLR